MSDGEDRYMAHPQRIAPGPGQESVWDYPRPPRIERVNVPLRIEHRGRTIADAQTGWRILETSHPPVYYLPPDAFTTGTLGSSEGTSFCEFKGTARYWNLIHDGRIIVAEVGWSYPLPAPAYHALANHIAVYASRVDACYVDGERVDAQAGDFYGGWITASIVGPFKGAAGTRGW